MIIYWIPFLILATLSIFEQSKSNKSIVLIFICFFLILIIGFRHEVGCDWEPYIRYIHLLAKMNLAEVLAYSPQDDLGHKLTNWLFSRFSYDIYAVNSIYGLIFIFGLYKFAKNENSPYLVFAIAATYLLTVVVMGYSRQGVAIGIILYAITFLNKGKILKVMILLLIASLFHKTALLMAPFFLLNEKYLSNKFLFTLLIIFFLWFIFSEASSYKLDALYRDYIVDQMKSDGTYYRLFINLLPAFFLLLLKKKWKKNYNDYNFYYYLTLASIVSFIFVEFFSTAIDRLSLYFIPLQLAVFSRLPILTKKYLKPNLTKIIIIIYYSNIHFIWINFGTHSKCWIPYQNIFFKGIF